MHVKHCPYQWRECPCNKKTLLLDQKRDTGTFLLPKSFWRAPLGLYATSSASSSTSWAFRPNPNVARLAFAGTTSSASWAAFLPNPNAARLALAGALEPFWVGSLLDLWRTGRVWLFALPPTLRSTASRKDLETKQQTVLGTGGGGCLPLHKHIWCGQDSALAREFLVLSVWSATSSNHLALRRQFQV